MTTADKIVEQLGGNRFFAMTGAKALAHNGGVTFKLPSISQLSALSVNIDQKTDTYTLKGYVGRGVNMREAVEFSNVQVDSLRRLFTDLTGMAVSL